MPIQRTVAPVKPAVTAAYVKAHTRIDINADDDYLNNLLIPAAIDLAENDLRRSFVEQTWVMTLDSFPGPSLMGVPWGQPYTLPGHAIILERPPILSIVGIDYVGLDFNSYEMTGYVPGTGQPDSDTFYYVDLTYGGEVRVDDVLRITPPFGQIWPIMLPQIGSVQVTYTAGYGADDTSVPTAIKQWLAMNVATIYENRERCVVGTRVTVSELPYVDRLMDGYRIELN